MAIVGASWDRCLLEWVSGELDETLQRKSILLFSD